MIPDADRAFAEEARDWLATRLPATLAHKVRHDIRLSRDDLTGWQETLAERNWYAIGWSEDMGGPGLSPLRRYLFDRTYGSLPAPHPCQFGIAMAGPVIHAFGTPEQRARFLPRIRQNRDFWCQGYSEPGAGSDLAALQCAARREGGHYIVTGQKIWTTWAHWADWMFCLVRTAHGARPQEGISFLLIDMTSPGITVRPIRTLDGDAEFNEVFLDEVRVPVENLVGAEGGGWGIAKFLLQHERFSMSGAARSRRILGEIRADAGDRLADPGFLRRLTRAEVDLLALEEIDWRLVQGAGGEADAARLKIRGTEIAQDLSHLRLELKGRAALPLSEGFLQGGTAPDPVAAMALPTWLNLRKLSIWGGSNEVQRMILAKGMGMGK